FTRNPNSSSAIAASKIHHHRLNRLPQPLVTQNPNYDTSKSKPKTNNSPSSTLPESKPSFFRRRSRQKFPNPHSTEPSHSPL
ncbi:hypothetical protein CCACVL1_07815, partial [Corchorus capsularis]